MILIIALLLSSFQFLAAQDFDLILRNGRVVDGMGNPWYRADVGIRDGRIAAIGDLHRRGAKRTIPLNDQVIAPGFIDMMAGSSIPLLRNPATGGSKLQQGITTMMAGEGGSDAPQGERSTHPWRTFGEYFPLLEKRGVPLNLVHNVGAAQIRGIVIGDVDRAPTPQEMSRMKELVAQAMRDGAVGFSTALIYPPGTYARTEELVEMGKVVAQFGGFYSTHMRNESFDEVLFGELFARHDSAIEAMRKAVMGAIGKVHAVLEPKQRERFAELIESGGLFRGFGGFGGHERGAGPWA